MKKRNAKDRQEFIDQQEDIRKLILPEYYDTILPNSTHSLDELETTLDKSDHPFDELMQIIQLRVLYNLSTLESLDQNEKNTFYHIFQDITDIIENGHLMNNQQIQLAGFQLGMLVGSSERSALISRHANKSIDTTSRNLRNGEKLKKKQSIITNLIYEFLSRLDQEKHERPISFKAEDLYEAIHQQILNYLRGKKSTIKKELFSVYKQKEQCKDDKFSAEYYAPSIRYISEICIGIKPEKGLTDDVYDNLMNKKSKYISSAALQNTIQIIFTKKEIETFLSNKYNNLN